MLDVLMTWLLLVPGSGLDVFAVSMTIVAVFMAFSSTVDHTLAPPARVASALHTTRT